MPHVDVVIVGSGPAGSIAALTAARGGARVQLVDQRTFPRDKACGDLIGPRGVQLLAALDIKMPGARRVGDLVVVGPTGHVAVQPALAGVDYPGYALTVPRVRFDQMLRDAALDAGAEPVHGRAVGVVDESSRRVVVHLAGGGALHSDVVIGADGANSAIAQAAHLVEPARALWGFALRCYVDASVAMPHIVLWEPRRWRLFPGYGWIFPTADGSSNVGLGVALAGERSRAGLPGELLAAFVDHLRELDMLGVDFNDNGGTPARLGGWIKMGLVGTQPARGAVLLAGDAAGLVNPLQGEGIAQAINSGHLAACAVLAAGPKGAARHYRRSLYAETNHHRLNVPVHRAVTGRPVVMSVVGRVLTTVGVREVLSGGWGLYWNDLVRGGQPSRHLTVASAAERAVAALSTSRHHL